MVSESEQALLRRMDGERVTDARRRKPKKWEGKQEEAKPIRTRRGRSRTRNWEKLAKTTNDTGKSGREQELKKTMEWKRNKTSSVDHSS
ncbi:hypothetical protein TNCV_2214871 [Trichonephila clavipes]|nr:hypothetical protein TNCV_2214871 [Trichonephila clavipes]